ncbi:MAG: hypothetical protein CM15mP127_00970 [Gammaproteobacteria bacterium]|nr:MAG: hypothetical protein CM15mP127_00970 [Gammaproteobacteria bacterium]
MELQAPKKEVYARVIAESVQNNQGVLILTLKYPFPLNYQLI